jgi:nicotinamidase-related amidase
MLDSKSAVMSPDRNPVLRWLFKRTFYAQFCAGENKHEVQHTADRLKQMGYCGVILEYALEVLEGDIPTPEETAQEIEVFRKGMRETIEMARPGDYIGLK